MKLKNKLLLDVVMLILLLFLMAYPVTSPLIHEILGIVTLICFVIHHLLNRKWYQTLMKGKLSLIKKVYIFINFILLIDILVIFLSGLTMSKLLPFLNFMSIGMARKAHMMATYWGFILMAIHLGLHLQIMLVKIKKYIFIINIFLHKVIYCIKRLNNYYDSINVINFKNASEIYSIWNKF